MHHVCNYTTISGVAYISANSQKFFAKYILVCLILAKNIDVVSLGKLVSTILSQSMS